MVAFGSGIFLLYRNHRAPIGVQMFAMHPSDCKNLDTAFHDMWSSMRFLVEFTLSGGGDWYCFRASSANAAGPFLAVRAPPTPCEPRSGYLPPHYSTPFPSLPSMTRHPKRARYIGAVRVFGLHDHRASQFAYRHECAATRSNSDLERSRSAANANAPCLCCGQWLRRLPFSQTR